MYIPQGVLFLPLLALLVTFGGALMNREGPVVIVPLALGAALAVATLVLNLPWLLIPVVGLWLAGLLTMIRRQRANPS